jgi:L-fuculose-phosphate aldolase
MELREEREQIAEYGRRLIRNGLTRGTGGNLSVCNRELNLMAISPSGMAYEQITPEDVVVLDLEGRVVDGKRKPSSELDMHSIVYRGRTDLNAVVHTHAPFTAAIAALQVDLPAASYLLSLAGGTVRCSKYATFATRELAEYAYDGMIDRKAVLLANHGLLAGGIDLADAFNVAEAVEFSAEVYVRAASMGRPAIIPDDELQRMFEKFQGYGR